MSESLTALGPLLSELEQAQAEAEQASLAVEVLQDELEASAKDLEIYEAKVQYMEARLPQLAEEKRQAVAVRAFKDAKRIAEETQGINDALAQSSQHLAGLRSGLVNLRVLLSEAQGREHAAQLKVGLAEGVGVLK